MPHTPKSLVITPEFEKRLASVNGVVVASKIPSEGQLYKLRSWKVERPGRRTKTNMTCGICSSACRDLRQLRNHFVTCVGRNGNPKGARWDDCLTPDDALNLRSNPTYAALRGAVPAAALTSEGIAEMDERNRKDRERLAAVNGIVIPSKLSVGQRPNQGREHKESDRKIHPCISCARKFATRHQVHVHFATCVNRNGNPTGARWNDAWSGATSSAGRTGTQSSSTSQALQMEGLRPKDYEFDETEFDIHGTDAFFPDRVHDLEPLLSPARLSGSQPSLHDLQNIDPQLINLQNIDPQLINLPSDGVQPYEHQVPCSSPNGLEPFDPHLPMDVLTNQALLSMVRAWQDVIYYGEEWYTLEHPHFQSVMKELVKRDMMSVSWEWTVDVGEVDMDLTRAMVEGLKA